MSGSQAAGRADGRAARLWRKPAAARVVASRAGRRRHDGRRRACRQRRAARPGEWSRSPLAVAAGQLSVGWCNDYVDRERDAASGRPDKPVARGDISPGAGPLGRRRRAGRRRAAVAAFGLAGDAGARARPSPWPGPTTCGLKSTACSVVPYTIAFGLLPVFVVLGLPGAPLPPWWAPLAGALLGAGRALRQHASRSRRRPGDRRTRPAAPAGGARVADPVGDAAAGRVGGARLRTPAAAIGRLGGADRGRARRGGGVGRDRERARPASGIARARFVPPCSWHW